MIINQIPGLFKFEFCLSVLNYATFHQNLLEGLRETNASGVKVDVVDLKQPTN